LALENKIEESGCDIICLQETKRQTFDMDYIKKICPRNSTSLNTCLLWVPQEELLPFGMTAFLMGKLVSPMNFLFQ
jgi:hypothetical protein